MVSSISSIIDVQSGKLLVLAFTLMIVSFYVGTLFSTKHATYTQDKHISKEYQVFSNKVTLSYRGNVVTIPDGGLNVCPMNYSEYIPCHDVTYVIKLKNLDYSRRENFERHCPLPEERVFCLIPPPKHYTLPIKWPISRDYVWQSNVNHSHLADVKGGQNWVHPHGKLWWFPGGGTHFKHGASEYIQRLGRMITNGRGDLRSAGVMQVLDVGCGVASFSAYLLPLGIQTMSFAPKDGHENQIQFALERGIGAMIAVLGTTQLSYPSSSFDMVHCSRCRVDWHEFDGILLKEVDRLLRIRGYFVYSAPPAYRKDKDFPSQWEKIMNFTNSMCWKLVAREVQTAVWLKTGNMTCLTEKVQMKKSSFCNQAVDLARSWKKPLENCLTLGAETVIQDSATSIKQRLSVYPKSLEKIGVTVEHFNSDTTFWKHQVDKYWNLLNISDNDIRNIMDMNSMYGGFASVLSLKQVWVMNVVPSSSVNTLPAVYDRGLTGTFHDWCEPFSTYPRTYDLIHAFQLFSLYKNQVKGCQIEDILLEVDRMLRPLGWFIVQDNADVVNKVFHLAPKYLWNTKICDLKGKQIQGEPLLIVQKSFWITD